MRLVWTLAALADRRGIYEYIEADNPRAAQAIDDLMAQRADRLIAEPKVGRPGRVKGTRELVVHPSYILIYDIAGDLVRILRVLHTSRSWPPGR